MRSGMMVVCACLLALAVAGPVRAQVSGAGAGEGAARAALTPPQVESFLDLLADPSVRLWLETQAGTLQGGSADTATGDEASSATALGIADRMSHVRQHIQDMVRAVPTLGEELERAGVILLLELEQRGLAEVLLLVAGFVVIGYLTERLFWRLARPLRRRIAESVLDTVAGRLRAVGLRLLASLGMVAAFALGSVGAFLAFEWPILLREIVVGYLVAFLVLRISMVAGRFLFSPQRGAFWQNVERFRIVPMDNALALFWFRRLALFSGWLAFGWVTVEILVGLGMAPPARAIIAYGLGLGLLVIGIEGAWRRTHYALSDDGIGGSKAVAWFLTVFFVVLWVFWVARAMGFFWTAALVVALPVFIGATQRAVNHLLRPADEEEAQDQPRVPSVLAVCLERGLRAVLIIGAALLFARAWDIDLVSLTAGDELITRLTRGALNAVVIILLADFAWAVLRTAIDRKLAGAELPEDKNSEEARRLARVRTLLPILRNALMIVLAAMTVLMAMAAVGIEIGPLIAGAGVVGVAVGFGAQTLVRDIFSGMFFLLDDAFRVGEYIQSGSYKGTVEAFSLRSIKLRHHRGPLYTVPFGELSAIQNMSRDWVIDKLVVSVTYDTDLENAKKLIKQIGKDLAADPEFAPHILQPLKMQGVEQFGDFAIELRLKIMTKPGEQFVIRRRAYALLKKAFDANGIKFAFPMVKVAGGDEGNLAAANQALQMVRKPEPGSSDAAQGGLDDR